MRDKEHKTIKRKFGARVKLLGETSQRLLFLPELRVQVVNSWEHRVIPAQIRFSRCENRARLVYKALCVATTPL